MRQEFPRKVKLAAWKRAAGKCENCGALLMGKFQYDHEIPCAFDGKASIDNVKCLCLPCHDNKTYTQDIPTIAKSSRILARHAGLRRERKILAWRNFSNEIVRKPRQR